MRTVDLDYTVSIKCGQQIAAAVEKRLRLVIRPRPWWLPKSLHRWLLAHLLYIEHFTGNDKEDRAGSEMWISSEE